MYPGPGLTPPHLSFLWSISDFGGEVSSDQEPGLTFLVAGDGEPGAFPGLPWSCS